jgi:hypothetical protein
VQRSCWAATTLLEGLIHAGRRSYTADKETKKNDKTTKPRNDTAMEKEEEEKENKGKQMGGCETTPAPHVSTFKRLNEACVRDEEQKERVCVHNELPLFSA